MWMSSRLVLGGEFHCPAALCLKWATGPVSRPDPCMGKHTGLHRLQATTSISSCTTKRREKREAVILDVLFWWLALWHLTSSKTIDTPVTVTLADGTWRGLSAFIISLELLFFSCSPHISGAFPFQTEWSRCLIGQKGLGGFMGTFGTKWSLSKQPFFPFNRTNNYIIVNNAQQWI